MSATVFGARTNNYQVCLPFSCSVNNFALWSALPLDRFCAGEATQSFIQDILGRRFLGLPHLFLSWRWWSRRPQKALAKVLDIVSRTGIGHVDQADGERLRCREQLCCLTDLVNVRTVETT
jgi:hypothetical protein